MTLPITTSSPADLDIAILTAQMTRDTSLNASLALTSRFENIEVAERALLDLCRRAGWPSDEDYLLVTALREAVANAIRHGNRQDPKLLVRLEYAVRDSTVTVCVEDEGTGFDPSDVPDPTDPENLLRPNGRGIFYMRQFMSRVEFRSTPSGGTAVLMERKLDTTDANPE
jgi:serine/threonine-protein kinase RsbW